MLRKKKFHLMLILLLVFAFIGEQPKLKEDLHRAASSLNQVLQVNQVLYSCQAVIDTLSRSYRSLSNT